MLIFNQAVKRIAQPLTLLSGFENKRFYYEPGRIENRQCCMNKEFKKIFSALSDPFCGQPYQNHFLFFPYFSVHSTLGRSLR